MNEKPLNLIEYGADPDVARDIESEFVNFDDLMEELERDPEIREAIIEARRDIAEQFYKPGNPHYERLMRGQSVREYYYPYDTPKNSFIERWLRILCIAIIIALVGWEMWK